MKPKETVRRRITDVHGSLKSIEVRALVKKKGEEEKQKKERANEVKERRIQGKAYKM